ncbi:MAG: putative signal transducing protein [Candidatus Bipolaricaulaceae bacterium]
MEKWVKLTTVWGEIQAQLLKGFLEGEGIPVRLQGHVPPSVYPVTVDGLAEVQLLVPEEDLVRAQEALAAYRLPEEQKGEA